jgi:hypothetical protein
VLQFTAQIEIIGVNPYVELPTEVLEELQKQAKRATGPIPVKGTIDTHPFTQTVVKFRALWRLYINTPMIKACKKTVGDIVTIEISYDASDRTVPLPPLFAEKLEENQKAKETFEKLPPYRQKEIARYIANLKNEDTVKRVVDKTIQYLLGKKVIGVLYS